MSQFQTNCYKIQANHCYSRHAPVRALLEDKKRSKLEGVDKSKKSYINRHVLCIKISEEHAFRDKEEKKKSA